MNRIELEAALAERMGLNPKISAEIIENILDIFTETLAKGEPIKLTGFATISVKNRAARLGKNPKTGEQIHIPASRKVSLRAGKGLNEAVNKK